MGVNVSTNRWATSSVIVGKSYADGCQFLTIASAITYASANSLTNIFIKPGTYTENFTLPEGMNISSYAQNFDALTNVKIVGKITMTDAGTSQLNNLYLQTNSDYAISMTGTNASILQLNNCYLNASNYDFSNVTNSNTSTQLRMINCGGNTTSTYTFFKDSGSGSIVVQYCNLVGSGTGTSTKSAGGVTINHSITSMLWSISGTAYVTVTNTYLAKVANNTSFNITGDATSGDGKHRFLNCIIDSGTAVSITCGASASIIVQNLNYIGLNNNSITGTGTLEYDNILKKPPSVTTTTRNNLYAGGISFDDGTNTLSTYTVGTWTPTLYGASTAGTTTYGVQAGFYTKIGNKVTCQFILTCSAATGTGDLVVGGLPFTIKNQTYGNTISPLYMSNGTLVTWPASTTYGVLIGAPNTTVLNATMIGAGVTSSNLQIQNRAFNIQSTISFQV